MRELIYLSESKLRQFRSDKAPSLLRLQEIGGRLPFAELKVAFSEDSDRQMPDLAKVLRRIDRSERWARWWEDEGLEPGDWVQFETRMNYTVVSDPRGEQQGVDASPLLFWQPSTKKWVPGQSRLLLHGSPKHLVGERPATSDELHISPVGSAFPVLLDFMANLASEGSTWEDNFTWLMNYLERRVPREAAIKVGGYARVTAVSAIAHPRTSFDRLYDEVVPLLVASPLFVEYLPKSQ